MHTTNLRKVGGSVMLAVPPAFLDILRLQPGATVGVTVERGRIIVKPQKRRRYTLKELLAKCDPKPPRARGKSKKEQQEWLDSSPVGGELV